MNRYFTTNEYPNGVYILMPKKIYMRCYTENKTYTTNFRCDQFRNSTITQITYERLGYPNNIFTEIPESEAILEMI